MSSFSSNILSQLILLRRKYLTDPTEDVKVATEGVLADFLHEIQDITILQKHKEEKARAAREVSNAQAGKGDDTKVTPVSEAENEQLSRGAFMPDGDEKSVDPTKEKAGGEVEAPHDTGGMWHVSSSR